MEIKEKSEAEQDFEHISKDIKHYNNFMQTLFSEISKKKFSVFKYIKLSKDKLLENMELNVKELVIYINKLDENINKEIYKLLSCIYGSFLGDAEGGYCEFSGANINNMNKIFIGNPLFGESPGQVTDDSEMAMSFAFAILDNPDFGDLNSDYLFYFYGLWHLSKPRDEGITTRKALRLFKVSDFNPEKTNNYEKTFQTIKKNNNKSLANGFIMRTSPFIVWCYFRYKKQILETFNSKDNSKGLFDLFLTIRIQAHKDNICTHPNDSLSVAHSLFCIMSLGAICDLKPAQILNNMETLLKEKFFKQKESSDIKNMILSEIQFYKKDEKKLLCNINYSFNYFTSGNNNVNTHMGFYYHAFRLTLFYLYYFDEIKGDNNYTKFRTINNQICCFGGDTDTNAAIVGAVIGPLIGYKNFGEKDFEKMVSLVPKKRFIFTPALMVIYVHFLKDNINNGGKLRMNFLKMIIYILFEKIDVNNLSQIFSKYEIKNSINEKNK